MKLALILMLVFVVLVYVFILRSQDKFLDEIRRALESGPEYYLVCDIVGGATSDKCDFADRTDPARLDVLVNGMRLAEERLPPSKAAVSHERMLKIGRGNPQLKQYIGCYRLIQYVGFDNEIYLNQVKADLECTHVHRYDPGYASLAASSIARVGRNE
jgi:hypothetical protein